MRAQTADLHRIGTEIHPEIPMPHWATSRYLDDDGRIIADEASASLDGFDIELSQAHAPDNRERYQENVSLWWSNEWASGITERETCTILPDRIPGLIAALQHAQELLAPPRTIRRPAETGDKLRELDS